MNHPTALFLLAAKQAEIKALQQLSTNCLLVTSISELVHQLQRERGISNIFLASGCELFALQRQQQLLQSVQAEQQLRTTLNKQYLQGEEPCHSSRLLSGISLALQGVDHLAGLREQIQQQKIAPLQATEAYSRLIAAWLAVILELPVFWSLYLTYCKPKNTQDRSGHGGLWAWLQDSLLLSWLSVYCCCNRRSNTALLYFWNLPQRSNSSSGTSWTSLQPQNNYASCEL